MTPEPRYFDVIDATWPASSTQHIGGFVVRDGRDASGRSGGKRVSAASQTGAQFDPADIDAVEAAQRAMGQTPLFMIRGGDTALDSALAARGYSVMDPVTLYAAPIDAMIGDPPPKVSTFCIWEPLAIQRDIWAAAGIGPARMAIMERAGAPKTSILGRMKDHPAGTAFVAIHDGIAMVHAMEVLPEQRRQGWGRYAMRRAAIWAREHGATEMTLLCVKDNAAANGLYSSIGMAPVGEYHYRSLHGGE
ncbi:MAG: GNAT family N-acetyltransferase [Paracoccaceae bacterium]